MNRTTSTEMTTAANVRGVTSIRLPLALPTEELFSTTADLSRRLGSAALASYRRHRTPVKCAHAHASSPTSGATSRPHALDRSLGGRGRRRSWHWHTPTNRAWSDLQSPPEIGAEMIPTSRPRSSTMPRFTVVCESSNSASTAASSGRSCGTCSSGTMPSRTLRRPQVLRGTEATLRKARRPTTCPSSTTG